MPLPKNLNDVLPSLDELDDLDEVVVEDSNTDDYDSDYVPEEEMIDFSDEDIGNEDFELDPYEKSSQEDYYEEEYPEEQIYDSGDSYEDNFEPVSENPKNDFIESEEDAPKKKKTGGFINTLKENKKIAFIFGGVILLVLLAILVLPLILNLFKGDKTGTKNTPNKTKTEEVVNPDKLELGIGDGTVEESTFTLDLKSNKDVTLIYFTVAFQGNPTKFEVCDTFDLVLTEGVNKDVKLSCNSTFDKQKIKDFLISFEEDKGIDKKEPAPEKKAPAKQVKK